MPREFVLPPPGANKNQWALYKKTSARRMRQLNQLSQEYLNGVGREILEEFMKSRCCANEYSNALKIVQKREGGSDDEGTDLASGRYSWLYLGASRAIFSPESIDRHFLALFYRSIDGRLPPAMSKHAVDSLRNACGSLDRWMEKWDEEEKQPTNVPQQPTTVGDSLNSQRTSDNTTDMEENHPRRSTRNTYVPNTYKPLGLGKKLRQGHVFFPKHERNFDAHNSLLVETRDDDNTDSTTNLIGTRNSDSDDESLGKRTSDGKTAMDDNCEYDDGTESSDVEVDSSDNDSTESDEDDDGDDDEDDSENKEVPIYSQQTDNDNANSTTKMGLGGTRNSDSDDESLEERTSDDTTAIDDNCYNEETEESTWEAPQMEVAAEDEPKDEASIEGDAAEGSELIETEEEVVDNDAKEVVEEPPSPSHEEDSTVAENELPAGWTSSVDETTGKTFYYNEETGESSWERPNAKVEVVDDVSKDEASVVIGSDADVREQETGEEQAKAVEELITDSGRTTTRNQFGSVLDYLEAKYVRGVENADYEETGETSWERPYLKAFDEDQIENVPTGDTTPVAEENGVNVPEESSANEVVEEPTALALDGAEEEEPTTLDEADEPTAVDEVKMEKVLPSGWKEVKHEATQNTYYWNEVTNETSWDYPEEVIAASDDVANVDTEKEEDKNDQVDLGLDSGHGRAADVRENDQSTDNLPLPEGWLEAVDGTTGSTYFYNEKTNETSWDRPVSIPDTKLKRGPGTSDAAHRCRPAHAITTFGFGGGTRNSDSDDESLEERTSDGTTAIDDNCYNEKTEESTWEAPQMEVAAEDEPKDEASIEGDEAKEPESIEKEEEVVNDAAKEVVEEPPSPSHEEIAVAEDELPDGSMSSVDETTGKTFYYIEETRESSCDKPSIDAVARDEAPAAVDSDANVQETTGESVEVTEETNEEANVSEGGQEPVGEPSPHSHEADSELPPGWGEAEYEGYICYYNKATGETSRERPSVEDVSQERNVAVGDTKRVAGEDEVNMPEESHANEVVHEPTAFDGAEEEEPTTLDEADELAAMSKNELLAIIAKQKDEIVSIRVQYNFLVRCYNNYREYHSIKIQRLIERYHQVSTISGALQTIATRLARLLPVRRKRVNDDNDETTQSPKRMRCW